MDNKTRHAELQEYITILKTSKTDNDKFAALMLFSKCTKPSDIKDEAKREEVFQAIGFQFLNRLIKTSSVPEGCPEYYFKLTALNILSSFATDNYVRNHSQFLAKTRFFLDIVSRTSSCDDEELMVDDSYSCLFALMLTQDGRASLIRHGTVKVLCKNCLEQIYGHEKSFELLISLLHHCGYEVSKNEGVALNTLLKHLSEQFRKASDANKFIIGDKLNMVLVNLEQLPVTPSLQSWVRPVVSTLAEVLQNKLAQSHRATMLKLASSIIKCLGVSSMLPPAHDDMRLILLITHLSSIEIRILLENSSYQQVTDQSELLSACYRTLEGIIIHLTTQCVDIFQADHIIQIQGALTAAINAVIYFIQTISTEYTNQGTSPVTLASIRFLGSWLAEETESLRQEVYNILPYICELCNSDSVITQGSSTNSCPAEDTDNFGDNMLQFLLPGFVNLLEDDTARTVLLKEPCVLHRLLCSRVKHHLSSHSPDNEGCLKMLCSILLKVVSLEENLLRSDPIFQQLLMFITTNISHLVMQKCSQVLVINLIVISLLILAVRPDSTGLSYEEKSKFFCDSIDILSKAHSLVTRKDATVFMKVSKEYAECWEESAESWTLAVQAMRRCVPLYPELGMAVLDSGWIPSLVRIEQATISTADQSDDSDVKQTYQSLLRSLVKDYVKIEEFVRELSKQGSTDSLLCLDTIRTAIDDV